MGALALIRVSSVGTPKLAKYVVIPPSEMPVAPMRPASINEPNRGCASRESITKLTSPGWLPASLISAAGSAVWATLDVSGNAGAATT